MRRSLIWKGRFVPYLLFLVIFIGCAGSYSWQALPDSSEDERTIFVVSHGWHTGLILPYESLSALPDLEKVMGESTYFEFGWGDADFYQGEEVTSGITLKAILWPTESVLHIVSIREDPRVRFRNHDVVEVRISRRGLARLVDFVSSSFYQSSDARLVPLGRGLYHHSHFFRATGGYQLTNNCNTWVAEALERAGLPVSSFLTLTADGVMGQTQNAMRTYKCCPN